ncbi:MAG: cell division protein ZapA [Elusimicrobia bacterium]|nr:cell division protein ZapA [Elusimicrobiota bacterium]
MNEKVEVEIARRRLLVEIEGLTPFEINGVARSVNEKYEEIQAAYPKVADTSKLAIYTALYLAVELYKLQQAEKLNRNVVENGLDGVAKVLQQSLAAVGAEAP